MEKVFHHYYPIKKWKMPMKIHDLLVKIEND